MLLVMNISVCMKMPKTEGTPRLGVLGPKPLPDGKSHYWSLVNINGLLNAINWN